MVAGRIGACGQSVEVDVDKEIRTDIGLVRILDRPTEGETVMVMLRRVANATLGDLVQVRNYFLDLLENNFNQNVPNSLEYYKYGKTYLDSSLRINSFNL